MLFRSKENVRFREIATRLEGTVKEQLLRDEGLKGSLETLGEDLERVRKQEAWVSEQR